MLKQVQHDDVQGVEASAPCAAARTKSCSPALVGLVLAYEGTDRSLSRENRLFAVTVRA